MRKINNQENESKIGLTKIIYIILLLFYGFFMLLRSPLSPGAKILMGTDCSVFTYIAQGMNKGLIPYKDLFDHKGMIIYFLNFFGNNLFNGTIGVWIIELIFMYLNFLVAWKIVKLFTKSDMISFFSVIISFLPIMEYFYYGNGNKTEEYALPFILLILYTSIKYLKNRPKEPQNKMWFVNGLASAVILWLQPNLLVVGVVFLGIIGLNLLINKQFKNVLLAIVFFGLGLAVVSLPIVIYLLKNNALKHCINVYLLFNLKYTGDEADFLSILTTAIGNWSRTALSTLSLIVLIIGLIKSDKKSNEYLIIISSIIFLIISYIISAMSGRSLPYYAIICIPAFVYPTCLALNYVLKDKNQGFGTFLLTLVVILVMFCGETNQLITKVIEARTKDVEKWDDEIVADYIKERTNENDEVIVLGNRVRINLLSERTSSAKYFFQTPIAYADENISKEFFKWLKKDKPKIIVNTIVRQTEFPEEEEDPFVTELFDYLEKLTKKGKYIANKKVAKKVTIYERVK